jgi:hypothetical protein
MAPHIISGTKVMFGVWRSSVTGRNSVVLKVYTFTTEHYKNACIGLVMCVCIAICLPVKSAEALCVFSYFVI